MTLVSPRRAWKALVSKDRFATNEMDSVKMVLSSFNILKRYWKATKICSSFKDLISKWTCSLTVAFKKYDSWFVFSRQLACKVRLWLELDFKFSFFLFFCNGSKTFTYINNFSYSIHAFRFSKSMNGIDLDLS